MKEIFDFLINYGWAVYIIFISSVAFVVTCYDKIAAKKLPKHRTPEKTLLGISALGGSAAMLFTMLLIRHKTKHVKFMLGIPIIILIQAVLIYLGFRFDLIG